MHLPIAPPDNFKWRYPAVDFLQHPPLGLGGLGEEAEPHGFGKAVGYLIEAKEIDFNHRLGIGQEQVEKYPFWPRHQTGLFRLGVNPQLRQKAIAAFDHPGPASGQRRSPLAVLRSNLL